MIRAYRLYNGSDGNSHMERGSVRGHRCISIPVRPFVFKLVKQKGS